MTKTRDPKRLVVDASVARAAGRTDHPVSKACRRFLESVLDVCHRVVFTREIVEEWNEHQSGLTLLWRSSMFARKKVAMLAVERNNVLRDHIASSTLSQNEQEALLKDVHLIEAALGADLVVASLDEAARGLFRRIAHGVGPLRQVIWVNPAKDDERAIEWLEEGAKDEEDRRLSFLEAE